MGRNALEGAPVYHNLEGKKATFSHTYATYLINIHITSYKNKCKIFFRYLPLGYLYKVHYVIASPC